MRILIALALTFLAIQGSGAQQREREFNPRTLLEPIRAITDAPIATPAKAANKIGESELVLGVVIGDAARAYPINMLTGPQREIINDKLGGRSIAATW